MGKKKGEKNKIINTKISKFDYSACLSKNVIKSNGGGKMDMLLCCKCLIEQIAASLAHIQAENVHNDQKHRFWVVFESVSQLIK